MNFNSVAELLKGLFGRAQLLASAGIVPFVRELIQGGTAVVIAANEEPCINDCTAGELEVHLRWSLEHVRHD